MSELNELRGRFRSLVRLREKRDELKAAYEAANEEYRAFEGEVFEELDEGPMQGSIKIDLGEPYGTVSFRTRSTVYGRINDFETALESFERDALMEELTRPDIRKRRLHELVRSRLEQNQDLPDGVDYYENRGITISRQKGT